MPCETCDGTLTRVGDDGMLRVFWCPRCGTLAKLHATRDECRDTGVPKLVERCRLHRKLSLDAGDNDSSWHQLGIAESINVPGDRP